MCHQDSAEWATRHVRRKGGRLKTPGQIHTAQDAQEYLDVYHTFLRCVPESSPVTLSRQWHRVVAEFCWMVRAT